MFSYTSLNLKWFQFFSRTDKVISNYICKIRLKNRRDIPVSLYEDSDFENEIYLGIRPEDISLENKSEIAAEIKIDLIENLGSEKIIYSHLNNKEIRIKSTKNIKDKDITIYLPKNKLYLFDNNKIRLKRW